MKKSRVVILLVVVAAVIGFIVVRGSSSSDRARNAGVSLIGTSCKKPGAIKKVGGVTHICGKVRGSKKNEGLYYGVATIKNWRCDKPGATRFQNGIFSVCAEAKKRTNRKWALTVPMPVAVKAIIAADESSVPGALESAGVPIPDEIVKLPGMVGALSAPSTTNNGNVQTTIAGTATSVATTDAVAPPTTLPSTSTTTAVPTSTDTPAVSSTSAPATTTTSTTTMSTTTTAISTTTPAIPKTTNEPELVPATCADGGECAPGDVGPAGGIVIVADYILSEPPTLIEVAPVTWFGDSVTARVYAQNLNFGGFDDWQLPTQSQILSMRRDRARFVCSANVRCTNGFHNSTYWTGEGGNPKGILNFAGTEAPEPAAAKSAHFVRPVRVIANGDLGEVTIEEPVPS